MTGRRDRRSVDRATAPAGRRAGTRGVRLFLAGDVMIGRGIDQVLPQSVPPKLHEAHVGDARRYVELAEHENGPIPEAVGLDYPWGDALEELERAEPDARIVNLETAVTTSEEAWPGKGIHYRTHPGNVGCLVAAGVDVAALANNHVLDWGRAGLTETLETLRAAGVRPSGAGRDRSEARAAAAVPVSGGDRRVLVFGLASPSAGVPREWAAGRERSGVSFLPEPSPETARDVGRRVRAAKGEGDLAVLSVHWGRNWGYRIPTQQRRFARRLVEGGGIDVVHGHSSHHPKGFEVHRGRLILYGCGDLLNDYEGISGHEEFRPGLTLLYLPVLDPRTGRLKRLEMVPMRIRRFRLERAGRDAARWLRDTLETESERLGETELSVGERGRLRLRPNGTPGA